MFVVTAHGARFCSHGMEGPPHGAAVDGEMAMRRYAVPVLLSLAFAAHAGSATLRVGSQVLTVGDSAARVVELLGKPAYKSHKKTTPSGRSVRTGKKNSRRKTTTSADAGGEQWQYRRGDRVTIIVIADGKVSAIEDHGR
jgi:Protein of unknown function (DUF2845)